MNLSESTFRLQDKFITEYAGKQPEWGPVGYVVYKRTYARSLNKLDKGSSLLLQHQKLAEKFGLTTTEEFWLTLVRVVEGTYRIQEAHCKHLRLPWSEKKAQRSAITVSVSLDGNFSFFIL